MASTQSAPPSPGVTPTPQYGFVIDQRKCIGCHACTVACKAENDVPLGRFRTWVKYTEKGRFPEVKRHFTVLRCNHCDAAPCVEICPVNALHKRKDAIVDLDRDICIGCRACMQACPYDALYFNDDGGVAEKCHYCAHRTEVGLEPACVVVCPEQAIVAGDVSDPETPIAKLIREQPTSRRRLEKGTKPRVWYVDALPESLVPGKAAEPSQYLWSQRSHEDAPPPVVPGFEPTPDITTTLDVPHPPAWGWHVWAYLVTKNISAGAAMVAPFLAWLGVRAGSARDFVPEIVALVFLAVTNALLVHDLGRPERFWRILLAPNTRSWLVKGAWVLTAFGAVTTAALVARWAGAAGVADVLRWVNLPLGVAASGYSAFLFAQCKGRDLWLGTGKLFVELVARASVMGLLLAAFLAPTHDLVLVLAAVIVLVGSSAVALRDHGLRAFLVPRERAPWTRLAAVRMACVLAVLASVAVGVLGGHGLRVAACAASVAILIALYERAWIRAGQAPAIS